MSRKQKIIVSITVIILVSLILIGLTYAYFLTKITGNTNEKSISVSTANLVLEYGENTNVVQGINNAEPGYSVEKIFTATNKGNSSVTYGAALESIVNGLSRQEDLVYTLTCTSYLKSGFSLSSNGTIAGTVDGTCNGVSTETKFPSTSTLSIMTTNTIDTTHTHAYKLTVTYKEMGVDQSVDMNKTFSAKVNIVDLNAVAKNNPYSSNKNSLAYNIIENARTGINGTELLGSPKTKTGTESTKIVVEREVVNTTSWQEYNDEKELSGAGPYGGDSSTKCTSSTIGKYIYDNDNSVEVGYIVDCDKNGKPVKAIFGQESTLSITNDDYGTSYYYRGAVTDNYVNFAGLCWRIVRIEGDGSIKLTLEDKNTTCESATYTGDWGYSSGYYGNLSYAAGEIKASDGSTSFSTVRIPDYVNDTYSTAYVNISKKFENDLSTKLGSNKSLSDYLKSGDWCINENGYLPTKVNNSYKYTKLTKQDIIDNSVKYISYVYGSYLELGNPTLICSGTNISKYKDNTDMYVATLTLNEVEFAGASTISYYTSSTNNNKYYLFNENTNILDSDVTYGMSTLSMAQSSLDTDAYPYEYGVNYYGTITEFLGSKFRPSIQLKNGITISGGNGTKKNPYVVE